MFLERKNILIRRIFTTIRLYVPCFDYEVLYGRSIQKKFVVSSVIRLLWHDRRKDLAKDYTSCIIFMYHYRGLPVRARAHRSKPDEHTARIFAQTTSEDQPLFIDYTCAEYLSWIS